MTSDAKIGLLLGLVFIFIIAFIINGLPTLHRNSGNNNELTTNMVSSQNGHLGLAVKEHKAQQVLQDTSPVRKNVERGGISIPATASASEDSIVSAANKPVLTGENNISPASLVDNVATEPKPETVAETSEAPAKKVPAATEENGQQIQKPKRVEAAAKNTYVVCEGDNLTAISKKLYGPTEGVKQENILRIFKANQQTLRSVDELEVGQTLVVPPLPTATTVPPKKTGNESIPPGNTLKNGKISGQEKLAATAGQKPKQNGRSYTVREGDSLWRIATEQLGNGNRYTEIVKLNPGILNDEDGLAVGMRLKIPAQ
jgi:nucleoid-associated protein YgaU